MLSSTTTARQLICVPIIHTQADLGSMSKAIRELYVRTVGKEKWKHHVRTIEGMWQQIRQQVEKLGLDYYRVRLYQDGLPNSDHAGDIVRDLAEAGSENHRLLVELTAKGAKLTGTEAPQLLLEEYELAQQVMASVGSGRGREPGSRFDERSRALLERRDKYIAERIDQTLEAGEIGLIFLGMLHSLEGRLSTDISMQRLASSGLASGGVDPRRPARTAKRCG